MRLRFAPSPTGNLHIGSARTALFNLAYAKYSKGILIIRIEDTDKLRSKKEFEKNIQEGLDWLGIEIDESPWHQGKLGPYRQSERMAMGLYKKWAEKLVSVKKAYYCFDTEEELQKEREKALQKGDDYSFSRKAGKYSSNAIQEKLAQNNPHTIRFKVPLSQKIVFYDLIRGEISFESDLIPDFTLIKSDGSPTYNFAVVVDDITMEITHVIRGEDHISNTPRQIILYEAFNEKTPLFAHLPMILGPDRSKLSKRHGAQSVSEYIQEGYLPDAIFNYLALLGWTPENEQEIMTKEEIFQWFKLEKITKSGAIFDINKLKWMNGQYIRKLEKETLFQKINPFIKKDIWEKLAKYPPNLQQEIVYSVKDKFELLSEINDHIFVYALDNKEYKQKITEFEFTEDDKKVLLTAKNLIKASNNWDTELVHEVIDEILNKTGLNKGKVFKPLRIAISAQTTGPNLTELMYIIGKDEILLRLEQIIG